MKSIFPTCCALAVLMGYAPIAAAQTGQSLIGNPLLSPAKAKEVKRQIVEAAHRELMPPPEQPAPMAMPMSMPPQQMGPAPRDVAKMALMRLRVMAIVGKSAMLAIPPGSAAMGDGPPMQNSAFPNQAMPFQAGQGGMGQQQQQINPPANQPVRRVASTMVRDQERAVVEGFDVIASIQGGTVRLALAAAPHDTIFQGSIELAMQSPSYAPASTALEKPSTDYANQTSPDQTSMSPQNSTGTPPVPAQNGQQAVRPRNPLTGESY